MAIQKTPIPMPSRQLSETERKDALIGTWLRRFAELYPMYRETLTKEKVLLWCEILSDLSLSELEQGFARAARTCEDFPTPAGIIKAAAVHGAPNPESKDYGDCDFCHGSGWEEVVMVNGIPAAKRCRCRAPGYIAPPPKPRALITSAEAEEWTKGLADVAGRVMRPTSKN